jgi:hypothetical protein
VLTGTTCSNGNHKVTYQRSLSLFDTSQSGDDKRKTRDGEEVKEVIDSVNTIKVMQDTLKIVAWLSS